MNETGDNSDGHSANRDNEIGLLDILIVLAQHKWLILGLPFLVAVITAISSLSQPDIYTGAVKILPPQQAQSAAAGMLAQLSGAAGLVAGTLGGFKNPSDIYVAMLKSRTVADQMIQRFNLMKPGEKYPSQIRQQLAGATNILVGKDGLITIEVDDQDPKRAADLANAYVEELIKFAGTIAVTEASQRRLFFEHQLAKAKDNLTNAEIAARQGLEQGGLVKVDDQGRGMVGTIVGLRAQITMKEVQIGSMRNFANDRNPELLMAQKEVESMKHELAKMEGAINVKSAPNGRSGKGSESLHLLREVRLNEVVFEQIARQYELAKVEESKESSIIQVMDKAIPPDRKSKPKRALTVPLSALAAGLIAVILAFASHALARARENPEQLRRLQMLRSNLTSI